MPRRKKLPKNVQQVGGRFRYDKQVRDKQGRPVRLLSTLEFASAGDAEAALFEALRTFRETGKTPTDSISDQKAAAPDDLKEVMGRHLDWYQAHLPAEYETMRTWCQKAGPLIREAGTADSPTFGRLAVDWICTEVRSTCKPSTQSDYRTILLKHVLPVLGHLPAREIGQLVIKDLLMGKLNQGLAKSTVVHIRNAISGVMNRAIEAGVVGTNPAIGIKKLGRGKARDEDVKPFTAGELRKLLAVIKERWPRYFPMVATLAMTGMRAGEALGLQWEDIDFSGLVIHVRRSLSRMVLGDTKGGKTRVVDMSRPLAAILQEHRLERKKEALANGWGPGPVFINNLGGLVNIHPFRAWVWRKALEGAGLGHFRIHDLRHTYATMRISKGDNIGDVSNQLGHHSVKFTLDQYYHWLPSAEGRAQVNELAELLGF
ncbi:MAG: site-specific integrase [Deltaproteobacteria bacterium]|nr:site-specific integrase [Deltaproteobacteria bacterium]